MVTICTECEEECRVAWVDLGIGLYQYGNGTYSHTDFVEVSECCGADYAEMEVA